MDLDDLGREIGSIASECGGVVSVAVRDVRNGLDLSVNDEVVVSSASIIKVPMLVEAMRQARDGEISLDTEHCLTDGMRVRGSGVMRYLHSGVTFTTKDLLWLMTIVSDNTATNMLMPLIGIEKVNSNMRAMGFEKTTLRRGMYDWEAIERGIDNVCAASEIAELLAMIAKREAVGPLWDATILDMLRHQQDASRLGLLLPKEARLFNKTGSRVGIFHDCGVVMKEEFAYSIAVLTKDAKSSGDAHLAIARISRAVYDHIGNREQGTGNRKEGAELAFD